jgi:hypothetical protein
MAEVGQGLFLGGTPIQLIQNNNFVFANPYETASVVPAAWSFRNDPFSASLNFATPGTLIIDLGMTYAWSDVSADIRGTGSNLSVLTANLTSSTSFNNFSTDGYTESSQVSSTGRFRSSDDTEFEFGSGNFTIECWYNAASDTTPSRFIFSDYFIDNISQSSIWFNTTNGRVSVVLDGGGSETFNQSDVLSWTANQWYHLALVRNGTTFTVYRDGTSVLSFTRSVTLNSTNQGKYLMGYAFAGGDTTYVQDYRIYKGIAKYTSAFTPPDSMAVYE